MRNIVFIIVLMVVARMQAQEIPVFVKKVFDNIYFSMANGTVIKPALIIEDNPYQVVSFYPTENELRIGTEFIKVCRAFGKDSSNAMAHVLGHELAHILLQQHDFVKTVGSGYASKEINKQMKNIQKTLRDSVFERQADEYSSFYAHIAGYSTVQIGEQVLDSIYKHFKLNDKDLSRYPSLNERKLICRTTASRMNVLKSIFDYANLATVAGNYDMAESCYQTIIKEKFPSREIFNNLSVVYLLKAIQEIDTLEFPYLLPIELDFESRLYSLERSIFSQYEENLNEAVRYAELALGTKKEYAKAWLNKSIAEFLLNRKEDAHYSLFKAKSLNDSYVNATVEVMEGLLEHKFGDKEKGVNKLRELKSDNRLASINYITLTGKMKQQSTNTESDSFLLYLKNLEKPKFNFQSAEAVKSDTIAKVLIYEKNLHIKTLVNDLFTGFEIKYLVGKVEFIMYKANESYNKQLIEKFKPQNHPLYSPSTNHHFIKIKNWIFEIENGQIKQCYLIHIL